MAKAIAGRKPLVNLRFNPAEPGIINTPLPMWSPPRGMDTTARLSRIEKEYAALLRNVRLRDGTIQSRIGTASLGASTNEIVGVVNFITSDRLGWLTRFRSTAVEYYDGSAWVNISVPIALTGTVDDFFTYTAYNDKMLFSNGIDGTFEFDFMNGSIQKLAEAPAAKFLTTFGGRVIASFTRENGLTFPTRLRWSVKNNSHDWQEQNNDLTGVGAGFEDLLSTPGGNVDQAQGVHPVSDYAAIVLRSRSTWQMTETGNPDAPYRFTRIFPELGTESGYSAAPIVGAVAVLMNDDVYLISERSLDHIGSRIRRTIFRDATDLAKVVGAYDYDEREYAILVPVSGGTIVWRYSFRDQGWTFDEFPFDIRWLSYTKSSLVGLSIDSSLGTIDAAGMESIDSEVGTSLRRGMFYAGAGVTDFVYNDDPNTAQDAGVDSPIEFITGLMTAATPLEKTVVLEVQVEYEADAAQTLLFEYRDGITGGWLTYQTVDVEPTLAGPSIFSVRETVIGHNLQFRITSSVLGKLRVLSFVPMVNVAQNEARG